LLANRNRVCFFLAIGAVQNGWQLAGLIEEQLGELVEVGLASERIAASFPSRDVVRVITSRGCSCDLLVRGEGTGPHALGASDRVLLGRACRHTLARLTRQLGTLRLVVGQVTRSPSGALPHVYMTLAAFTSPQTEIPTESLVEVSANSDLPRFGEHRRFRC
jgi:hypothetical protein